MFKYYIWLTTVLHTGTDQPSIPKSSMSLSTLCPKTSYIQCRHVTASCVTLQSVLVWQFLPTISAQLEIEQEMIQVIKYAIGMCILYPAVRTGCVLNKRVRASLGVNLYRTKKSDGAERIWSEVLVTASRWQSVSAECLSARCALSSIIIMMMSGSLPAVSALHSMTAESRVTMKITSYCCCNKVD